MFTAKSDDLEGLEPYFIKFHTLLLLFQFLKLIFRSYFLF